MSLYEYVKDRFELGKSIPGMRGSHLFYLTLLLKYS